MKPLVYLAGPITKPDPNVNAHEAIHLADKIMLRYPVVLFVPQLSVLHQVVSPKTHQQWLDYDFEVIRSCAAVLRLPGDSIGADMEERWAKAVGIPVFEYGNALSMHMFGVWTSQRLLDTDPIIAARKEIEAWGARQRDKHTDYGHVGH